MLDWETQTQYEVLEREVEKGVSREPSSQFRVHRQAERPCPECPKPLPRWGPLSPATSIRGRWVAPQWFPAHGASKLTPPKIKKTTFLRKMSHGQRECSDTSVMITDSGFQPRFLSGASREDVLLLSQMVSEQGPWVQTQPLPSRAVLGRTVETSLDFSMPVYKESVREGADGRVRTGAETPL